MTWWRRALLSLAAPALAAVVAAVVSTAILLSTGDDVSAFWNTLLEWPADRSLVNIANNASVLYLSGIAAAIGFRMNLFNIGVEGQYRVGAFVAAAFAGEAWLPGKLNAVAAILLAMLAGAVWAGIAGLLRVTRGVSEVISTIMLNLIAGSLVAYFLARAGVQTGVSTSTRNIAPGSWIGGIPLFSGAPDLFGLALLAVVVGVGFSVLLNRTRFGFNLRATGASATAAVASGVDVRRMIVISMLMSGAVAGLIGMPTLFGASHNYGTSFQTGIGFAGIAVALLGRNHPVGIALGALIFAFLSEQGNLLNILAGVSPDIVAVTQGVIVLAVVIAYEVVRRYRTALEQAAVAKQVQAAKPEEAPA
ncbi:MAG: ABC transporter permease [Nocardioidaceae bacterium]